MTPQRVAPAHGSGTNSAPSTTNGNGQEEHLVSALQAALHSLSGTSTSEHDPSAGATAPPPNAASAPAPAAHPPVRSEGHSPREKPHAPTLDISVGSDQLHLRGTGVDVEPALLSGNVVLNLSESTSIKQIVLLFRGKARVPSNPHDPHVLNSSPNQYIVCSHEWTFLEGEKKASHTLKAGRHLFPFELRLGGALPSSLATYVNGGASISYKLIATAVRPRLAANLTAALPITLLRTFAPESLEYQQTLEIENTWPEKVMYALMIPHKAWAAGDELTALLKFAPLTKGVRVLTVTTHLCETTKTLARAGHLEKTRNVVTRKHEIKNGQAVSVEDRQRKRLHNALQRTLGEQGTPSTGLSSLSGGSSPGFPAGGTSAFVSGTSTPIFEGISLSRSGTHNSSGSGSSGSSTNIVPQEETDNSDAEITTSITVPLPPSLTPSHSLDPIIVTYRIRWSVLLANFDGHTSELRCSLPIHILDYSLLDEARAATLATRRLLFGGEDAPRSEGEDDVQLPSYPSHVRDRVAMDVSVGEGAAYRPFTVLDGQPDSGTTTPAHEGASHPLADFPGFTQDTAVSPFAFGAPLSRVQTQATLPMQAARNTSAGATPPESSSTESSRPNTRPNSRHERDGPTGSSGWGPFNRSRLHSRANSRANSRAPSPERGDRERDAIASPGVARADETHVHLSNAASRQPHGLFSVTMKPLTSLTAFSAPWHANSHTVALAQHFQNTYAHAQRSGNASSFGSLGSGSAGLVTSASSGDLRALATSASAPGSIYLESIRGNMTFPATPSEVADTSAIPDYFTAAYAGGGVPPLETLRGLPTYDDSEAQAHGLVFTRERGGAMSALESETSGTEPQRSFSDSDLVAHFARVRAEAQRAR